MSDRLEEKVRDSLGIGELLINLVAAAILGGVVYYITRNPAPVPADMIIHEERPHSHYSDGGYDTGRD
mgnify:CR=1 FL=1